MWRGDAMNKMQVQELVSALADGQLRGEEFARAVEVATSDPAGREAWIAYHVIGDVLRSGELAPGSRPDGFLGAVYKALQQEPQWPAVPATASTLPSALPQRRAANDSSFRWKLVAGFASVAAVAAIAWSIVGSVPGRAGSPQLAAGGNDTVLTASERGVMIRDPQLDEFMAAHRRLGGASVLPAGFVRNATLEGPAR
jgi:sigma-E factor negative regulatory protein RseA